MYSVGDTVQIDGRLVILEKLLGKGKSGYSWLANSNNGLFVLKQLHNEPSPFYRFEHSKLEHELFAYDILAELDIPIPDLIAFDTKQDLLLKDYIEGTVAGNAIAAGKVTSGIIEQLVNMYHVARAGECNLDYFPLNFIITTDEKLVYIDYEINPFSEEWDLWNWGIYYWLNTKGIKDFLETGDALKINQSAESGRPITMGLEDKVHELIKQYE